MEALHSQVLEGPWSADASKCMVSIPSELISCCSNAQTELHHVTGVKYAPQQFAITISNVGCQASQV
jgi:hypothetical protein